MQSARRTRESRDFRNLYLVPRNGRENLAGPPWYFVPLPRVAQPRNLFPPHLSRLGWPFGGAPPYPVDLLPPHRHEDGPANPLGSLSCHTDPLTTHLSLGLLQRSLRKRV